MYLSGVHEPAPTTIVENVVLAHPNGVFADLFATRAACGPVGRGRSRIILANHLILTFRELCSGDFFIAKADVSNQRLRQILTRSGIVAP